MPSLHRAAASIFVTTRPPNRISPAAEARSPEMRPNRLVFPAPFGPTIPTTCPAPTLKDRSSAMTTRPNRFVTWSSSSRGSVIRLLVGRQEVRGDLGLRDQGVVDDLHFDRELGALLPLHAGRRGDGNTGSRAAGGEVELPGDALDADVVDGVGDLGLIVRVAHGLQGRVRDLEEAVVADVGIPLTVGCFEVVGQLL